MNRNVNPLAVALGVAVYYAVIYFGIFYKSSDSPLGSAITKGLKDHQARVQKRIDDAEKQRLRKERSSKAKADDKKPKGKDCPQG